MYDINKIEESRNVTFNVDVGLDVSTTPPTPVGFVIVGLNSTEFEEADLEVRAYNTRTHANWAKQKRTVDATTEADSKELTEMTQAQRWIYLRHCVKGWYGFQENGAPAEFTSAKAINVLKARPLWAQLVANSMEVEANFAKG